MRAEILHSGFDGLKFTIQTSIPLVFRDQLAEAKQTALITNADACIGFGSIDLYVRASGGRAFSAYTGEYGAEWYFLDPDNRPSNNPGVTVDFRALLLATGGIAEAETHFRDCMIAFGIPYAEHLSRVSRVDFAIDFLAPWFEPDRNALVAPAGTGVHEISDIDKTETHATGPRVTGIRAGAIANRQLAIYDKRLESLQKRKVGWLYIWAEALAKRNLPMLNFNDRETSQIWRFELRLGSKQLRNRWEMRSWQDLREMIGDAYVEFCQKIRYTAPTSDSNRARWPTHDLWHQVSEVVAADLHENRLGILPSGVKEAEREEHKRMLDRMILGLLVSRAATTEVPADMFMEFIDSHIASIQRLSDEHPTPIDERLGKAANRYRFR